MKIYLDACILIAYYSEHNEEKQKKEEVKSALSVFEQAKDIDFYISSWGISEMRNILLSKQRNKHNNEFVQKCELDLRSRNRLGEIKINILRAEGRKKKYDLEDFFSEVGGLNLKYHPGLGDAIHCVIMENNEINHILTFDEKNDFKKVEGLIVIHPREVKI